MCLSGTWGEHGLPSEKKIYLVYMTVFTDTCLKYLAIGITLQIAVQGHRVPVDGEHKKLPAKTEDHHAHRFPMNSTWKSWTNLSWDR